ncbi:MAG TPA: TonB family protein [Bryobacteraceae bacterium]
MPSEMFSSSVLFHLAGMAVRSLVLAAVAAAALPIFRVRSAAAQHAVWTVVVAAMLALAALEPSLPPVPLRVLRVAPAGVGQGFDSPAGFDAVSYTAAAPLAPTHPRHEKLSWPSVAAAMYLLGVLAFCARLLFGYLFASRLIRASRPIDRPWALEVYESTWISVPLTVGWLRPRILLPAGWEQWEHGKLQAVLAHERTHVQRSDWAIAMLAGINRCVFWFHPLSWGLERRLASLAEEAADDGALLLVATGTYAQALLDMAAAVKNVRGRLVWEAMAMANAAEVRKRIDRILDETRQVSNGLTRSRWAALIACSLPLIYVASVLQLAPAVAQQTPASTPTTVTMRKGKQKALTADDAAAMEERLTTAPDDLDARSRLVRYYFANHIREPRLHHTYWLIQNHPESEQAGIVSREIATRTSPDNEQFDYARAATLWSQQAASHANDVRVLSNAAEFLGRPGGDFGEAERLLLAARRIDPQGDVKWAEKLGRLYASAILGNSGDAVFQSSDGGFATRVKLELESSSDRWLLHFTGASLAVAQRPQPGRPLPAGVLNLYDHPALVPVVDLAGRLLARAQALGVPTGPASASNPAAPVPDLAASTPLSHAPLLLHKVDPVYPPAARLAGVEGTVRMSATIGTDGRVTNLQVLSAPAALAPAALDAVKRWSFTLIPAATTAVIDMRFSLTPADRVPAAPSGIPAPVETGERIVNIHAQAPFADALPAPPPLASSVDPTYPALARQARIQGTVRLMATVDTSGHITHLLVISGHPLLVPAALEAVKQWVYSPVPEGGSFEIDVPFSLPSGNPAQAASAAPPDSRSATAASPSRAHLSGTGPAGENTRHGTNDRIHWHGRTRVSAGGNQWTSAAGAGGNGSCQ